MKRLLFTTLLFLACLSVTHAQLRQQCTSPGQFAIVQITAVGDININPCPSKTVTLSASIFDKANVLNEKLSRTITPTGTTGARTINKPAGTVNIAAGGSSVTVTDNIVNTSSIIQVMARTNDATCYVRNYVPATGSFVINMTAICTAETSVGFIITN